MKSVFSLVCGLALAGVSLFGAGRQLTGVYAPASSPALPPEEAAKKFTLPEGFEMRIFASEPQVVNPVAMTWDERGRLWVVELYEYPLGAPAGTKPRDNVKILEDTDNDGRADKVTVFKDGLNLATGVLVGYGGVFVGQAPHLIFYEDTNGDDRADKETIVKTGFGLEDRHELLNGFTWGPDGYLYMTHGVFTYSKVKNPNDPEDDGVLMTAAVARYHPRTKKFEIFAEGTSNPWGVDFDAAGNAFVSACVIDHAYHMSPGGIYTRQAGSPPFQHAYELLPSIVDHKHFRAAYSGIQVYQGNAYPEDYKGTLIMGNIHDNSVHQDKLTPNGATFKASAIRDLIRANDGWFRPVSQQVGPDGNLWIMDWYDKYPCYQNANADPEGVDRAHGRIWRLVYTGKEKEKAIGSRPEKEMHLGMLDNGKLVELLKHPNVWQRRTAQRLLSERGPDIFGRSFHGGSPLHELLKSGENFESRLGALWTLHGMGALDQDTLDKAAEDKHPAVRAWAARLTGEMGEMTEQAAPRLRNLANDPDITVRTAVAVAARQFVSSSLTIDTAPRIPLKEAITGGILSGLWFAAEGKHDQTFSFHYWMAIEPLVAYDPVHALGFYEENGATGGLPFSGVILNKIMRRVCDLNDTELLNRSIVTLGKIPTEHSVALVQALNGLIEGLKGKNSIPPQEAVATVAKWAGSQNEEVASRARQLGTMWGDVSAVRASIKTFQDSSRSMAERVKAIESVRSQKMPAVREALLQLLEGTQPDAIKQAAIQGLSEVGGDEIGEKILAQWKNLSPAIRRASAEALISRRRWAQPFLSAVENKSVQLSDIPAPVVRNLLASKDDYVRNRAATVIGKFREAQPDKLKLIAKKRAMILRPGAVDLQKGREMAQKTCFTCHKLHGEGADVGPDLTGVGRSSLDALLANVIDPNQIIGIGYENVEVETKDDRVVAGRLVENTDARVRIVAAGPKEEIVSKGDIKSMRVSEMSVMPEGLEQMADDDFRNMIWYILNPPEDKKPIQIDLREKSLVVRARVAGQSDGVELLTYHLDGKVRPYLHPVKDPNGKTVLTQDRPEDHPWQHGIFTGLHKVNGTDFWSEKQGQIRFKQLLNIAQEQDYASFRALAEWVAVDGKVTLEEEQDVTVYTPLNSDSYTIDFGWTLRAGEQAVKIGKHEYGGFAVRPQWDKNQHHLNANGEKDKSTAEKRAAWCNVSRAFGNETFGIAVLDHPSNPGFPAMWRVDDQGLINPSPSLQGDWSIEPNKARSYRYRLIVHKGAGEAGKIDAAFREFSNLKFDTVAQSGADGESVALWNPHWKVLANTRDKLTEYHGRRNVLMTHPFEQDKPAALERVLEVPSGKKTELAAVVAADDQGDWELRVFVNNKPVKKELIDRKGDRWKTVKVDLSDYAGQRVALRLENAANNWDWEYGYWGELSVQ